MGFILVVLADAQLNFAIIYRLWLFLFRISNPPCMLLGTNSDLICQVDSVSEEASESPITHLTGDSYPMLMACLIFLIYQRNGPNQLCGCCTFSADQINFKFLYLFPGNLFL